LSRGQLEEHRRIWRSKPVLGEVYAVWFDALLDALPREGRILEVGAGPGFFSEYARRSRGAAHWLATDIVETPWNDLVADGSRLPLRSGSVHGIAALDLVHHLADPERFFSEARRVLVPGGSIAVIEPWITPLSYPLYRWLHQEGCRSGLDPWHPFADGASKEPFEGDGGVFTRLLRQTPAERWRELGLRPPRLTLLNGFAYLLSLGFRDRSLLPRGWAAHLIRLDRRTAALARFAALRALVVWQTDVA
jgi:SAM-dependent methyltransferase